MQRLRYEKRELPVKSDIWFTDQQQVRERLLYDGA
jgi:hypothetical protein